MTSQPKTKLPEDLVPAANTSPPKESGSNGNAPRKAAADAAPPSIAERVQQVVTAALDRKAADLKVLHLAPVTDFTDYFLVCSGSNPRQVQAICKNVEESLRAARVRPLHVEGLRHAQWVLLDYGDFLLHVFDEATRDYYGLERLWSDAPDVTEEFVR